MWSIELAIGVFVAHEYMDLCHIFISTSRPAGTRRSFSNAVVASQRTFVEFVVVSRVDSGQLKLEAAPHGVSGTNALSMQWSPCNDHRGLCAFLMLFHLLVLLVIFSGCFPDVSDADDILDITTVSHDGHAGILHGQSDSVSRRKSIISSTCTKIYGLIDNILLDICTYIYLYL